MFEKRKLVLLPCEGQSKIFIEDEGSLTLYVHEQRPSMKGQPHQLYMFINDKIDVGDWFLSDDRIHIYIPPDYRVEQCIAIVNGWIYGSIDKMDLGHNPDWSNKIIVTTDTQVKIKGESAGENTWYNPAPDFSQSFLRYYMQQYNEGNILDCVDVEMVDNGYEVDMCGVGGEDIGWYSKMELKLDSDRCVNIKTQKDSWNRSEMINIIHRVLTATGKDIRAEMKKIGTDKTYIEFDGDDLKEWIENNL